MDSFHAIGPIISVSSLIQYNFLRPKASKLLEIVVISSAIVYIVQATCFRGNVS